MAVEEVATKLLTERVEEAPIAVVPVQTVAMPAKPEPVIVPLPPPPTQVPPTAKHPVVTLNPTLEVEVAEPEMLSPLNVVVPNPEPEISSALIDVVALSTPTVVVAKYRFPPAFLNAH